MDLGPLRQLALELNFDAHGVGVVLPREGQLDLLTTGIWQRPLVEDQPVGRDFSTREPRRIMAIKLLAKEDFTGQEIIATLERGAVVVAAETIGGTAKEWQIDGVESTEPDYLSVILVPRTSKNQ